MDGRVKELARQSGGIDMTNHAAGGITTWVGTGTPEFLEKFAELARADEREACEEAVEEVSRKYRRQHYADAENIADECAAAIRARGEK